MDEEERKQQKTLYNFNLNPETVYGFPLKDETGLIMTCTPLLPGMTREEAVQLWEEALK